MCFKVPVDAKMETAVGFPRGWCFYFAEDGIGSGSYTHEPVRGLYLLSEGGKKFRSVQAVAACCKLADEADLARKFYTHVGLPDLLPKSARRPSQKPPPMATSSLSKYRVVGSRVYCIEGEEGRWGTITEKLEVHPHNYTFSVSRRRSTRYGC